MVWSKRITSKRSVGLRRGMPGGLENPLGARALHLYQNGAYTLYTIYASSDRNRSARGSRAVVSACSART